MSSGPGSAVPFPNNANRDPGCRDATMQAHTRAGIIRLDGQRRPNPRAMDGQLDRQYRRIPTALPTPRPRLRLSTQRDAAVVRRGSGAARGRRRTPFILWFLHLTTGISGITLGFPALSSFRCVEGRPSGWPEAARPPPPRPREELPRGCSGVPPPIRLGWQGYPSRPGISGDPEV